MGAHASPSHVGRSGPTLVSHSGVLVKHVCDKTVLCSFPQFLTRVPTLKKEPHRFDETFFFVTGLLFPAQHTSFPCHNNVGQF